MIAGTNFLSDGIEICGSVAFDGSTFSRGVGTVLGMVGTALGTPGGESSFMFSGTGVVMVVSESGPLFSKPEILCFSGSDIGDELMPCVSLEIQPCCLSVRLSQVFWESIAPTASFSCVKVGLFILKKSASGPLLMNRPSLPRG